jgi:hypothetical protein
LLSRQILERDPGAQTKAAIKKMMADAAPRTRFGSMVAGLTLGSPEFQKR